MVYYGKKKREIKKNTLKYGFIHCKDDNQIQMKILSSWLEDVAGGGSGRFAGGGDIVWRGSGAYRS